MRSFFINSLDWLVNVVVVLAGIGIVIGAFVVMSEPGGGLLPAIGLLLGGFIWLVLLTGFIYLQIGIHSNTRRTAEAVEALLAVQRHNPGGG
ncbi:hypothetical protein GI374_11100 [Paracoccus sp. S-4012]|uniref:hypothetical protein n=1 Tax=Paracoccus sp. S-4012 TaxID=2665648 RepID=UPI0012B132C1|nr:hypothetical protein [Paracoccus sp. S-4012]MRX50983.1 hypothetical protein [Paracoccus sp. S-4012]